MGMIGNMGWSIIGLTLIIKALLLPLAYQILRLDGEDERASAGDGENQGDARATTVKLQQEMMALYKKEKVNPASGCLPILLQIPIFFSACTR